MLVTLALIALFGFISVGANEMHARTTTKYALRCTYGYLVFQMPEGVTADSPLMVFTKNILKTAKPSAKLQESVWGMAYYLNDIAVNRHINARQQAYIFASVLGMTDYEHVIGKIRTRKTVREVIYLAEKAMVEQDPVKRYMVLIG